MAWPIATRAQQSDRLRRIAVLIGYAETDRQGKAFVAAFLEGLLKLGWKEGGNVRVDIRWAPPGNADATQQFARELIALQPDRLRAVLIWQASSRSNRPATYPQSPQSGAYLRRPQCGAGATRA